MVNTQRSGALKAFMEEAPVVKPVHKAIQNRKKQKDRDETVFYDLDEEGERHHDDPSSDEDHIPAVSVRVPRKKR